MAAGGRFLCAARCMNAQYVLVKRTMTRTLAAALPRRAGCRYEGWPRPLSVCARRHSHRIAAVVVTLSKVKCKRSWAQSLVGSTWRCGRLGTEDLGQISWRPVALKSLSAGCLPSILQAGVATP